MGSVNPDPSNKSQADAASLETTSEQVPWTWMNMVAENTSTWWWDISFDCLND